jgi:hypothetical protein
LWRIEFNECNDRFKRTGKRADIFLSEIYVMPGLTIDGSLEHVLVAAEASLKKLGVENIHTLLQITGARC